jgi:DNA-binding GntR family transcriptional regulator
MSSETIARSALYQEVAERLRSRIFAHELAPGAWIDEQALAEEYGISRTPLREALKVLAAEGLVTLKPRRGCYVTELTERDLDEIFPVLALLEGRCACEAAQKASEADLKRLDKLHEDLEKQAGRGDIVRFFEANQAFHRAVQDLAGNRWLSQVIADMRKVLKLTRHQSLRLEGRVEQSLKEHRAILAALRKGDAARAEQRMREHLLSGRAALAELSTLTLDAPTEPRRRRSAA